MSSPELSVVIPFFNEEACCEEVLHRLTSALDDQAIDYELLPVNNGSTDRTGYLLDQFARSHPRIKVITVPRNEGYGWGIISGLKHSAGQYAGYMDGDAQVSPNALIQIFSELKSSGADLCKATRVTRLDGLKRNIISGIYNNLFRILFLCPVKDINAKPKIMRRASIETLELSAKDWFIDAELMLKSHACGMQIQEVAIEFLPRNKGRSKVRLLTILEFINNMARYFIYSRKRNTVISRSRPHSLHP